MRRRKKRFHLPFHRELLISILSVFVLFVAAIFAFQYSREKEFRKQLLNSILQSKNEQIFNELHRVDIAHLDLDSIIVASEYDELRISIFSSLTGEVLAESSSARNRKLPNHDDRPEFILAKERGTGYALRYSETLHEGYFYSTRMLGDLMVRSALPFDTIAVKLLQADKQYIYFLLITSALVIITLVYFCTKLGRSISALQEFSELAEQNKPITPIINPAKNDIGKITRNIVRIYKKLRNTKEALSIEKEKLIKHLQFSKEGLAVFSPSKKNILTNNLFIQYTNLIADTEIRKVEDIFKITELEKIFLFIEKNGAQTIAIEDYLSDSLLLEKNGKTFQIECIIFPDNTFEISINDITQKEQESRLKRQLTQNIAHELKTPVSSIQGYIETIIDNATLPEEKRNFFIERCYIQTKRLTELLQDISLLNRIDESNELFEQERINLSNMIEEIASDSAEQLAQKKMTIETKLRAPLFIQGNNSLLYSIFRNLTDNAISYAGEGVHITIHCYMQDSSYYYFSFSDSGTGVSQEHLNRLFERFYRVDKGRSRKLGGTGLGLAIVKNAVLYHKGEIVAKNRAQGGLEFLFTLRK